MTGLIWTKRRALPRDSVAASTSGKTLDHTYLYHTHHWRLAASYVTLTRQRESAQVFVAQDTARDAAHLARQMIREDIQAASVAWVTADE